MIYQDNPDFKDSSALDFRMVPDAKALKDLRGFQPIPLDRIGQRLDEYNTSLPSAADLGRSGASDVSDGGLGQDSLDRR